MAARAGVRMGTGAARAAWHGCWRRHCCSPGAKPHPPQPDPMQVKLNDLDERLTRVERVISNQSLVELSKRIDDTRHAAAGAARRGRGAAEQPSDSSQAAARPVCAIWTVGWRRSRPLPRAPAAVGRVAVRARRSRLQARRRRSAIRPPMSRPSMRSRPDLRRRDHAVSRFPAASYPQSSLADNAQYWLGEAYYVTRDYDDAVRRLPRRRAALSAVAQGARCAGQARLHAVRAEAHRPMLARR